MAVRSGTSEKPAAALQEMEVLSCACGHLRIFLLELDGLLSTSAACVPIVLFLLRKNSTAGQVSWLYCG